MDDDFENRVRELRETPFTLASIRLHARTMRRRRRRTLVSLGLAGALGMASVGTVVRDGLDEHSPIPSSGSVEACRASGGGRTFTVDPGEVGFASARAAARTEHAAGTLMELRSSPEHAQVLAVAPDGADADLITVALFAHGWMVTETRRCQ